jgi:hypothetical protein
MDRIAREVLKNDICYLSIDDKLGTKTCFVCVILNNAVNV